MGTQLIGGSQPSSEASSRWSLGNTTDWDGFAFVDDDSVELVIGLDDQQPNSYSKLVDLIVNNGGKIANTMLMGGKIWAVVADMPHSTHQFNCLMGSM